jgi:hypothetical protein
MAFGQQSGPPATARQVQDLLALLHAAGHADFRDARGPMGFTQRQAAGKFTRDEAAAFIAQLEEAAEGAAPDGDSADDGEPAPPPPPAARPAVKESTLDKALRRATPQQLAAELQRRGWVVLEP